MPTPWGGPRALTMLFHSAMAISAWPRSEKCRQSSEKKVRSGPPLCTQRERDYPPGTRALLPATPPHLAGTLGISPSNLAGNWLRCCWRNPPICEFLFLNRDES